MDRERETVWAMVCHLVSFSLYLGLPFGNFIGPLVVWLVFRDQSRFIDEHGREILNFQISTFLYTLVLSAVAMLVAIFTFGLGLIVVVPLAIVYFLFTTIPIIFAAVDAKKGRPVRYPLTLRFL
ncbi:DUF4870 domain-containing protein [Acanthopleuribacter pedis]|uniref:DUF4870 domain-containing protein n=1 Tax=Acanthopleuribacter pedis TaxID=442870 RepID=A0A8J7QDS7_9BACT|nr:DUF4870 domain-containing protein [Acanthopleuribacter pedis]MBO1321949.1 DUF4870 domain-containing protein [Acanthopleuribacter pedis]